MKKKQPAQLSGVNYIKTKARTLPIYKCYINSYWIETALTVIVIGRQHTNGNFTFGVYLVDTFNKGLFKSSVAFNQKKEVFDDMVANVVPKDCETDMVVEIDYTLAHNIIYGGYDLAKRNGYKPDKDFEISRFILEENDGKIEYIEINFGKNEGRDKIVKDNDGEDIYIKGLK